MEPTAILLFADQTAPFAPSVRSIAAIARESSYVVRKFFREALDVISQELYRLPSATRQTAQLDDEVFAMLLSEPEQFDRMEDPMGIYQTTLTCIARLADLILRVEDDPSLLMRASGRNSIRAVGLCTGLLSAAVMAASSDLQDLLVLSSSMVRVAFRLRVELHYRSHRIEDVSAVWGHLFLGVSSKEAEKELSRWHQEQGIPSHKQAYIAVASAEWVTLFGAPSTMQLLLQESHLFTRVSSIELYRANGAVHAAHLPAVQFDDILSDFAFRDRTLNSNVSVYSTSSCAPFAAATLFQLVHQILDDIFNRRLELTGTIDAIASDVRPQKSVEVISIGGSPSVAALQQALEKRGAKITMLDTPMERPSERGIRCGSGKVAVISVGGRFPTGDNPTVEGFWQSLLDGKEWQRKLPKDRWDLAAWQYYLGPDAELPWGCFLDRPGEFDARLFNISPREAAQMDPIQRLLMMCTYEALEMAGYSPEKTPATNRKHISAFFGQSGDDWRDLNHQQGVESHYVPSVAKAFGAGRLHYFWKFEAASMTVDAACGSSAVAIITACNALINRDCDMSIAGGGMLACSPGAYAGLTKGGFLSPTGSCKVFRNDVDGYCRGEAVAVVVLKRLEDAVEDNDNILGVIEGSARNHSAYAKSITYPHQCAQERVFRQALRAAATEPTQIGYAELHGTGTVAGDVTEVTAIANVFGDQRTAANPLLLGAVKANVGHSESAAAVVALIKALLVMKNGGIVPPQPGFESCSQLNPEFPPLQERHIHVAHGSHRQLQPGQKVIVNCFDATGGNACMVLSPAPLPRCESSACKVSDDISHPVVAFSGHTLVALRRTQRRYLDHVMAHRDADVRHLAYTTAARRPKHHAFRAAHVVKDMQELGLRLLEDQGRSDATIHKAQSLAFVFTGQGACYPAMGRELWKTSSQFRCGIIACQAVCDVHMFPSVVDFFSGVSQPEECHDAAESAAKEQLALVALQVSLVGMLRSWSVEPSVVLGHSIGEYAALYTSGALSLSDTIYLVGKRTELLRKHCEANAYVMLIVPMPARDVQTQIALGGLQLSGIACKNTPNVTVCSGPSDEMDILCESLRQKRVECSRLSMRYGFHSAQMDAIVDDLEKTAQGVVLGEPQIPLASTVDAEIWKDGSRAISAQYLARQTRGTVDFVGAVQACRTANLVGPETLWLEIGPDAVCTSMLRGCGVTTDLQRLLSILRPSDPNWRSVNSVLASLYNHGIDIDWAAYYAKAECNLRLVSLPRYAFDGQDFWWTYQSDTTQDTVCAGEQPPAAAHCMGPFLHHLTHDPIERDGALVAEFVSRVNHAEMVAAAQGHLVDGNPILPGSVYCEMGFAAAQYLLPKMSGDQSSASVAAMVLSDLDMRRPLVISTSDDDALIHTVARADTSGVKIDFSVTAGSETTQLGHVRIDTTRSAGVLAKMGSTSLFLVSARMKALVEAVKSGSGHLLRKSLIYKLFRRYIGYAAPFQALEQCFLTDQRTESVAFVKLAPCPAATSDYAANQCYWRDAVFHLAGFMLNGHPDAPEEDAYIAVAVSSIVFEELLTADTSYQVYAYMQRTATGALGDVYVFDGDRLIGLCADMIYKHVSRRAYRPPSWQSKIKADVSPKRTSRSMPVHAEELDARINPKHVNAKPALQMTALQPNDAKAGAPDVVEQILRSIAEETGWPYDTMRDDTAIADLGVDSLMTIMIASKLRSQKGIVLPSTTFRSCVTVADIKTNFGKANESTPLEIIPSPEISETQSDSGFGDTWSEEAKWLREDKPAAALGKPTGGSSSTDPHNRSAASSNQDSMAAETSKSKRTAPDAHPKEVAQHYRGDETDPFQSDRFAVEVFLIQGTLNDDRPPMYLVPDGAGSITSFLALPQLQSGTCIYGLHSPWVDEPASFTCTIEQATLLYLEAVRAKQPHGPYIFGGWSAGCVFAYELARQLLDAGEQVLGLIIIDMHAPHPLPEWIDTSKELWDFWCDVTGLQDVFAPLPSGQGIEEHLIQTFRALNKYQPVPMNPGKYPKHGTVVIWATKGMGNKKKEDFPDIPDPLAIGEWFCFDRTDFGPRGWDELVGSQIECLKIEGDHRSIMVPPDAEVLARYLERSYERFVRGLS